MTSHASVQWWIDTAGKLGPLCVALAVFFANLRQTQWTNQVSRRTAEVEDQKFRLALLDQRRTALDAVRSAYSEFMQHGRATTETVQHMLQALRVAELVFDDEDQSLIAANFHDLLRWQAIDKQVRATREHDRDGAYQKHVDALCAVEDSLLQTLPALLDRLRVAGKVRQVPSPVPSPFWQRPTWLRRPRR